MDWQEASDRIDETVRAHPMYRSLWNRVARAESVSRLGKWAGEHRNRSQASYPNCLTTAPQLGGPHGYYAMMARADEVAERMLPDIPIVRDWPSHGDAIARIVAAARNDVRNGVVPKAIVLPDVPREQVIHDRLERV